MDQVKVGKFIAESRKKKNLTQAQLAERLNITDRAISKWETGKGMPDSSIMLDLCKELNIGVTELLCGEEINMENYNAKTEENIIEITKGKERQSKKMKLYENIMGFILAITYVALIISSIFIYNNVVKRLLIILAFILLFIGISIILKFKVDDGYYECENCHNKYIPSYNDIFFSFGYGRMKYMKCPKCKKNTWNEKILNK